MDWHRSLGLTLGGLVLFRILWGLVGSWTARFVPMARRIGSVGPYLQTLRQRQYRASFGHGPLAVLSVFALLLSLATQIATGLFSVDVDGLESGPLAVFVSFDTGRSLAAVHEFNFNLLLALIGLHVAAIALYHFALGDNLVGPMISGRRSRADFPHSPLPENRLRPLPLVVAALLSLAAVLTIVGFG